MAVWLEMARIVLGRPCACALAAGPAPSGSGSALRGAARALAGLLRGAARALARVLRPRPSLALASGAALPAPGTASADASSASRARFAHPARGGFPHAGGDTGFGIDGKACASARADGARSGLRPRRRACAPSLRA